jgi:hypothetical protein
LDLIKNPVSKKQIPIIFASLIILLASVLFSPPQKAKAQADDNWSTIMFNPATSTYIGGWSTFYNGLKVLLPDLKSHNINTVALYLTHQSYRFKCETDSQLCQQGGNFGFNEARQVADLVHQNDMNLIVGFEILTHQNDGVPGEALNVAHPEYMLAGNDWQSGRQYHAWEFAKYNGITYRSLQAHTASADNAPPNLFFWKQDASGTRDPFNLAAEQLIFKMADEQISAFTATDGTKPVGFFVGGDELSHFYDDPVAQTGHTASEIFAMVFNNVYNHIKSVDSKMEVIMWGDMLDPNNNGGPISVSNGAARDTAGATELLNKNIIIGDWHYDENENKPTRFNRITQMFPSLGEFINKGFRVMSVGWNDVQANRDFIWTGNMDQARSGMVMGHIYVTFVNGIATEMPKLLDDLSYNASDFFAPNADSKVIFRGIADSILQTADLIGLQRCRGTDYFCGEYPNCSNVNTQDGMYQGIFRDYYCSDNTAFHKIIDFPNDYASYWKFDGNANDESGRNNGTLMNGATIFSDSNRGNVLKMNQTGQYVKVPGSALLNMGTGSFTVSAWVKAGAGDLGTIVAKGPKLNSLNLFLTNEGKLFTEPNGGDFWRYSVDGKNFRDNQWHHVVANFDSSGPAINLYVDNILASGTKMYNNGANDKSNAYDLYIGNNNGEGGQYQFNGLIDDVMIYNRVLSPSEITRIFVGQGGVGYARFSSADINQDNSTDSADLDILKSDFLKITANFSNPRADINIDGQCTVRDLGILMSGWGK